MSNYVRICRNCGHKNAESEDVCQGSTCKDPFLGDVEPVLDTEDSGQPDTSEQNNDEPTFGSEDFTSYTPPQEEPTDYSGTTRFTTQPMLSLEYAGKEHFIKSGMVMGKADATSDADVQIPGLPSYIHRRHCRFDFVNNQWQVTAIENTKFTNATSVNAIKVLPNDSAPIKNGDRLTLCDINFQVRIMI